MSDDAVRIAILCAKRRQLPSLPSPLWLTIRNLAAEAQNDFPDDPEGVFPVSVRDLPQKGTPGGGRLSFSLCLVGSMQGSAQSNRWYHPMTTVNCLPSFVADVIRPDWREEMQRGNCTRLCCEVSHSYNTPPGLLRPSIKAAFVILDWWGARRYSDCPPRGFSFAQFSAYLFYFSARCRSSFGYVANRLGQLQAERSTDGFSVVDRTRGVGYGIREYDHTVQIRRPSFRHTPLVLVELDSACFCGAVGCGGSGSRSVHVDEARHLAAKIQCRLIQVDESQRFNCAFDAIVEEFARMDRLTKLMPVEVPRNAAVQPELHLDEYRSSRETPLGDRRCCMM